MDKSDKTIVNNQPTVHEMWITIRDMYCTNGMNPANSLYNELHGIKLSDFNGDVAKYCQIERGQKHAGTGRFRPQPTSLLQLELF